MQISKLALAQISEYLVRGGLDGYLLGTFTRIEAAVPITTMALENEKTLLQLQKRAGQNEVGRFGTSLTDIPECAYFLHVDLSFTTSVFQLYAW